MPITVAHLPSPTAVGALSYRTGAGQGNLLRQARQAELERTDADRQMRYDLAQMQQQTAYAGQQTSLQQTAMGQQGAMQRTQMGLDAAADAWRRANPALDSPLGQERLAWAKEQQAMDLEGQRQRQELVRQQAQQHYREANEVSRIARLIAGDDEMDPAAKQLAMDALYQQNSHLPPELLDAIRQNPRIMDGMSDRPAGMGRGDVWMINPKTGQQGVPGRGEPIENGIPMVLGKDGNPRVVEGWHRQDFYDTGDFVQAPDGSWHSPSGLRPLDTGEAAAQKQMQEQQKAATVQDEADLKVAASNAFAYEKQVAADEGKDTISAEALTKRTVLFANALRAARAQLVRPVAQPPAPPPGPGPTSFRMPEGNVVVGETASGMPMRADQLTAGGRREMLQSIGDSPELIKIWGQEFVRAYGRPPTNKDELEAFLNQQGFTAR